MPASLSASHSWKAVWKHSWSFPLLPCIHLTGMKVCIVFSTLVYKSCLWRENQLIKMPAQLFCMHSPFRTSSCFNSEQLFSRKDMLVPFRDIQYLPPMTFPISVQADGHLFSSRLDLALPYGFFLSSCPEASVSCPCSPLVPLSTQVD